MKLSRTMRWIAFVTLCLVLGLLSYIVIGVYTMEFRSMNEMDFDGDGSTSIVEVWTALDVVKVPSQNRPGCTEYLDAKGGTHVYAVRCPRAR